jgi:hypothetical protein
VSRLLDEIPARWQQMFESLVAGCDVAPSVRLRTEGLMEAAVLEGLTSAVQLTVQMEQLYFKCYHKTIMADHGDDWQDFFPFPQIPAMAKRAPVYPSTAD